MNSAAIGYIDSFHIDFCPEQGSSKSQKKGPSQARFDGVVLTSWVTRTSTCTTKFHSKRDIGELFQRLGQEFKAVGKTFKDIAAAWESFIIIIYIHLVLWTPEIIIHFGQ